MDAFKWLPISVIDFDFSRVSKETLKIKTIFCKVNSFNYGRFYDGYDYIILKTFQGYFKIAERVKRWWCYQWCKYCTRYKNRSGYRFFRDVWLSNILWSLISKAVCAKRIWTVSRFRLDVYTSLKLFSISFYIIFLCGCKTWEYFKCINLWNEYPKI